MTEPIAHDALVARLLADTLTDEDRASVLAVLDAALEARTLDRDGSVTARAVTHAAVRRASKLHPQSKIRFAGWARDGLYTWTLDETRKRNVVGKRTVRSYWYEVRCLFCGLALDEVSSKHRLTHKQYEPYAMHGLACAALVVLGTLTPKRKSR